MSLVPEKIKLIGQTVEDGRNVAFVQRDKAYTLLPGAKGYSIRPSSTVWKLVLYPNGWYSEGQWISTGIYRRFPERKGVKLSCSKLDATLMELANGTLPIFL